MTHVQKPESAAPLPQDRSHQKVLIYTAQTSIRTVFRFWQMQPKQRDKTKAEGRNRSRVMSGRSVCPFFLLSLS